MLRNLFHGKLDGIGGSALQSASTVVFAATFLICCPAVSLFFFKPSHDKRFLRPNLVLLLLPSHNDACPFTMMSLLCPPNRARVGMAMVCIAVQR